MGVKYPHSATPTRTANRTLLMLEASSTYIHDIVCTEHDGPTKTQYKIYFYTYNGRARAKSTHRKRIEKIYYDFSSDWENIKL